MNNPVDPQWSQRTLQIKSGINRTSFSETSEAMFLTSGYVYQNSQEAADAFTGKISRMVYGRFTNPTVIQFETRLAAIEGAATCRATGSGMAAVNATLMSMLKNGDRIVASQALFISNNWVIANLQNYGIDVEFVEGTDLANWKKALAKKTTLVFLETPSNPTLQVLDLTAIAEMAHKVGAKVVVDNVFATPVLQSPLKLGADVVVYSATKHLDGQGRCLGGAVLSNDTKLMEEVIGLYIRHTGPILSPFNAWVLMKSVETLQLRVHEQCRSSLEIARFLEAQPAVVRVLYPGLESHTQHELAKKQMNGGFGTVISFEVQGGQQAAFKLQDSLRLIDISNNLGDVKTMITNPWTTTQYRLPPEQRLAMGVNEGLLRLSIGLEDVKDLIRDLEAAIQSSQSLD